MRAEPGAVCGSCGDPATNVITLRGKPVPACLRHLNHWRTPAPDYTCPTVCVESNHPGEEHADWLTAPVPPVPDVHEAVEQMLREQGLSDEPETYDSDIHSWRCSYPEVYGRCSCFQDLIDAVLAVPAIATALGERDLRARVEALIRVAEYRTTTTLSRDFTGRPFEASIPLSDLRDALAAQPTDADQ